MDKKQILNLVREYSSSNHKSYFPGNHPLKVDDWKPGKFIPYSGRVFGEEEVVAAVENILDFWLTLGDAGDSFQAQFEQFLGIKSCILTNSGSSANLLALSTLTSKYLNESKRIKKGDEIITVAAGFPTTVAPILQVGAVPVFIDAECSSANANVLQLEEAYRANKTKAVIFAHALGNPFDLAAVIAFCRKYDLWLIEDNCDSLGSTYSMPMDQALRLGITKNSPNLNDGNDRIIRWTGTWGDISTQSFYPPHHLTMGEGGCVNIINDVKFKKIAESFRDWGRDCWCPSGKDNSCNKRFEWKLGDLPESYDHKYTYSHLGYNLKPLDLQASIGLAQLQRLPYFIEQRKLNWSRLRKGLDCCSDVFAFALPTHAKSWSNDNNFNWDYSGNRTDCSWFGFMITLKASIKFTRKDFSTFLDSKQIGFRMFFGGNLVKQPAFVNLKNDSPESFRIIGDLENSDHIMNNTIFLGTYPGLSEAMIRYIIENIINFVDSAR